MISLVFGALKEAAAWRGREAASLGLLLLGASCVPLNAAPSLAMRTPRAGDRPTVAALPEAPALAALAAAELPDPIAVEPFSPTDAAARNAAIPLATTANPRAASIVFRAAGAVDQQRSLRCLAEAVYYEARSETEDGQRAVAQVVLNRVRHPAYPASVCGVVYQGPLRAGGGCQFTFTCDGSLGLPPSGIAWLRAQRIAADALAGAVHAPVGHATHYHTQQVLPVWAYRLDKVAVVGSHSFYRMTGGLGAPRAFGRTYAGREPSPAAVVAARLPTNVPAKPSTTNLAYRLPIEPLPVYAGKTDAGPERTEADTLPASTVREEFRNSGRYLADIPRQRPAG
jgi:spore germination cell wall hydrolase CwlJ-like protein